MAPCARTQAKAAMPSESRFPVGALQFTLGQSFTFLSKPVARGRMTRQQKRLVNAGDVATSQVEAIDAALDDLTSNRFVMGTHSLTLI